MKNWKELFNYIKSNNIIHDFNDRTSELLINRNFMNHELRTMAVNCGFNIFELDNTIVFF